MYEVTAPDVRLNSAPIPPPLVEPWDTGFVGKVEYIPVATTETVRGANTLYPNVAPVPDPDVEDCDIDPPAGLAVNEPAAVTVTELIPITILSSAPTRPPPVTGSADGDVGFTVYDPATVRDWMDVMPLLFDTVNVTP